MAVIPFERVVRYPMPGMNSPANLRFSPDSRLLTYLFSEDGTLVRQLWAWDLATAQARVLARAPGQGDTDASVSPEEALRRERQRVRGFGITNYAWAKERGLFIVPSLGEVYAGGEDGQLRKLDTGGGAIDPRLNPQGTAVAFVRDGELWATEIDGGTSARRLTFDASPPEAGEQLRTNGLAEFIAQEEMGRLSGFWWSPDGSRLAFAQVDNSGVGPYVIVHEVDDPPGTEIHRYPFAGKANARVRLGIVEAEGSVARWMDFDSGDTRYLARVDWAPDGSLFLQVQSRDQRSLVLQRYAQGATTPVNVLAEAADTWINLHDDLRFIQEDGQDPAAFRILWSSERSGFRHLYLYDKDGREIRQLTRGEWMVDRVIDVSRGWVYFLAGRETPLERHVYRVSVEGGEPQRLSQQPGLHNAVLSPGGDWIADAWDSMERPPSVEIFQPDGSVRFTIFAGDASEAAWLDLAPPEMVSLPADDGTTLYGALYRPALEGAKAAPLIVAVYGGPHVQQVTNSWGLTVDLRAQYLARNGFAVFKLDNRGSARRGHAFEAAVLANLGDLEVRDQAGGVRYLARDPSIDCSRVGIYGWSYGGYMALMCLLRAPDVFHVAVAGAPVTDWTAYDTHYTERYMLTPRSNPEGYRSSSAVARAEALDGSLLLIHGMIDENVHYRHTTRLVAALIEQRKPFELLPFPNERHMPRAEEDRLYMERRLVDHFQQLYR
jgi:dipeptidyl-peptidase 4